MLALVRYVPQSPDPLLLDFRAFYCGARTLAANEDPYRVEPLRHCEGEATALGWWRARGPVVVPAPLPPYALAAFIPFARMPYDRAALLWLALLAVATIASIAVLARTYAVPALGITALCALPLALVSLSLGQLAPIVVLSLALAALALERRRDLWAGWALVPSILEPHVGGAALISTLFILPRTRVPIALAAVLALVGTVLTVGTEGFITYIADVLPDTARANLIDPQNYGLAPLLAVAHVPLPIVIGDLSYLVMLVLGIVGGVRIARATRRRSAIAVIPPAFVLLGGTYLHISQMAIAIPAVLLLVDLAAERRPPIPLVALAVPWLETAASVWLAIPATIATGTFSLAVRAWRALALLTSVATLAIALGLVTFAHAAKASPHLVAPHVSPSAPAERAWEAELRAEPRAGMAVTLAKIPTWVGLVCLVLGAWRAGVRRH